MSAKFLEGKVVAETVLNDVAVRVERLKRQGISPGLGTILVGNDGASIESFHVEIPENGTQSAATTFAVDPPKEIKP